MSRGKFALGMLLSALAGGAGADAATDIVEPGFLAKPASPVAQTLHGVVSQRIDNELWYIVILSTLMVVTLLVVLHHMQQRQEPSARDIVNAAGLVLVIFGTIMLVLVVQTSEQLTAAIGLLGAVAGYLFRSVQETSGAKVGESRP